MTQSLILVDPRDRQIGTGEKMDVHRKGLLHRCFSIVVYNDRGEMLLQKRAASKYHSGGLWTNTCCGHPLDGEDTAEAAHRRLFEEMGFDCPLKERLTFIYQADLDHGMKEHEFDHLFVGIFNGEPVPNPEEADGYRWVLPQTVLKEIEEAPDTYTVWSKIAFEKPGVLP